MAVQLWVALIAALAWLCSADLPVHCVGDDVYGEWVLHLGPSGFTNSIACGHARPDNPKENWQTKVRTYKTMKEYKVRLHDNNTASDEYGNQGTWTMIYDEGWELRIGHRSFFAFSKYVPRPHAPNIYAPYSGGDEEASAENYLSICYETIDGWYHFDNNTDWGCYFATKTNHNSASPAATLTPMDILGPTGTSSDFSDFLQIQLTQQGSKNPTKHHEDRKLQKIRPHAMQPNLHPTTTSKKKKAQNGAQNEEGDLSLERFVEHGQRRVKHINASPKTHWKARDYPTYSSLSLLELGHMLGVSSHKNLKVSAVPDLRADHIKYADLPNEWDWRNVDGVNFVPRPRKQGSCGSCYAIAATQMVESRIRIKTNNTLSVQLSPQSILSCSGYSQGCDGGFPYLVGKYGQDYGFLEESCLPYQPKKAQCSWRCKTPRVWHTSNYHYIGGAYGLCSEVEMMREVHSKGPIIVGFNAPQDLFWYSEGIYHAEDDQSLVPNSFLEVGERESLQRGVQVGTAATHHAFFEKTNHAVLAVGWGVERSGKKYWIVQNTWGDDWGDNGYFKILRGQDVCAFEAMSVAFDPIIPDDLDHSKYKLPQDAQQQQQGPVGGMPEPEPEKMLAQRVQVGGKAQVIAGASSGFQLAKEEDSDSDELIQAPATPEAHQPQEQTMQSNALELNEGVVAAPSQPLGQHGHGVKISEHTPPKAVPPPNLTHATHTQSNELLQTPEQQQQQHHHHHHHEHHHHQHEGHHDHHHDHQHQDTQANAHVKH